MIATGIPGKFTAVWANAAPGGDVNTIPVTSPGTPGRASFNAGFPPETFVPVEGGGTPPWGADFNGILKPLTAWIQWYAAGGPIIYDAAFQASVGGYPKGAIVQSAVTTGLLWVSTADSNTTNPDMGGAGWQSLITTPTNITGNAGTATKLQTARTFTYTGDTTGGPTSFDGSANVSIALTTTVASTLRTARTIAMSGDVSWSVSFNGSSNVTAAGTLAASGVTAGTYNTVTVNAKGIATNGTNVAYLTGNQTITLSGAVTGSGATSIATTLSAHAVANSNLAQMAAHTIKGNNTGGAHDALDLTQAQVNAMLDLAAILSSVVNLSIGAGHIQIGPLLVNWGIGAAVQSGNTGTVTFDKDYSGSGVAPIVLPVALFATGTPQCENSFTVNSVSTTGAEFSCWRIAGSGTDTSYPQYVAVGFA